jgi:acetolactate decarboxylase
VGLQRHQIFQTSVMSALLDGVYDGDLTIGELLTHGDFGLGTFDALDGELLILDGVAHQLTAEGDARIAALELKTPFAVVTTFVPHLQLTPPAGATRAEVAEQTVAVLPSHNLLYGVRMTGRFRSVTTRTVVRQTKPYRPLVEVTRGEPVVEHRDVDGVVAGFRTPAYEGGIGVAGGHVHFLDANRRRGGHVLDFVADEITVEVCVGTDLHLSLPMTESFTRADLDPDDVDAQIEAAERHR